MCRCILYIYIYIYKYVRIYTCICMCILPIASCLGNGQCICAQYGQYVLSYSHVQVCAAWSECTIVRCTWYLVLSTVYLVPSS